MLLLIENILSLQTEVKQKRISLVQSDLGIRGSAMVEKLAKVHFSVLTNFPCTKWLGLAIRQKLLRTELFLIASSDYTFIMGIKLYCHLSLISDKDYLNI